MKMYKLITIRVIDEEIKINQRALKDIAKLRKEKPGLVDYDKMEINHRDIIWTLNNMKREVKRRFKEHEGSDNKSKTGKKPNTISDRNLGVRGRRARKNGTNRSNRKLKINRA